MKKEEEARDLSTAGSGAVCAEPVRSAQDRSWTVPTLIEHVGIQALEHSEFTALRPPEGRGLVLFLISSGMV